MDELIGELAANQLTYVPGKMVAEHLAGVTMVPLIGPTAVGKSTCMHEVAALDDRFGRVRGFTTRPRRPGEPEDEYRFLPHRASTVRDIAAMAARGELVQYAVHPTTGYIYGSAIIDYDHPYMMMDTLSSVIPGIRKLPFGKIVEIAVVATPTEWKKRSATRDNTLIDKRERLQEGQQSLEWSLAQKHIAWVVNHDGQQQPVAAEIRDLVLGKRDANPANRQTGQQLLKTFSKILINRL